MKGYMIVNSIVILIVVCALSVYVFRTKPESFADDPNLAPAALAGINRSYCGRNIVFPNMNQNDFLASSRALKSTTVDSLGSCNLNANADQVNDSYSVVHENYMYYSLRKACMLLSFTSISYNDSTGHVTLAMDRSSPQTLDRLAKFISLNPIFVEFSVTAGKTSIAYFPVYNPTYTTTFVERLDSFSGTEPNASPLSIMFVPMTNQKFFKYEQLGDQYGTLKRLLNGQNPNSISANVYFLDYLEGSAHNIRYELPLSYDKNGTNTIFSKDFEVLAKSAKVREYQFYKNVYMFHKYQVPPIFTFKFTIKVSASIPKLSWTRPVGFESSNPINNTTFAQLIWPSLSTAPFDPNMQAVQALINIISFKQTVTREELGPVCQSISNTPAISNTLKSDVCVCNQTSIPVPTTIARVYMGSTPRTAIGFYDTNCWTNMNDTSAGDPINNVFSLVLKPIDCNKYNLMAITGVGNTCNQNPEDSNNTYLELPYSSETVNIILTVSPYEKILAAHWNIRDANKQIRISRRRTCTPTNNFYKLFVDGERNESTALDNMYLKYNTKFVDTVSWVKLGYVNIHNEIYYSNSLNA